MPTERDIPQTFDEWLGAIIEGEAKPRGGRAYLTSLMGWSKKTVDRRIRGEAPFLASEVEIVARALGVPTAELVERALRGYGGMEKLIAEHGPASEAPATVDPADNVTYIGKKMPPASAAASKRPEEE